MGTLNELLQHKGFSCPEYSLEGLVLKLKLQYFGHLMRRTDSLEKTLMLRKIEGGRRRGRQRMRWLDGISDSMDMNLSKLQVLVIDREAWGAVIYGVPKSRTQLSNWTGLKGFSFIAVLLHHCRGFFVLFRFFEIKFHLLSIKWFSGSYQCLKSVSEATAGAYSISPAVSSSASQSVGSENQGLPDT